MSRLRDEHGRFIRDLSKGWTSENATQNALSKVFTILAVQSILLGALSAVVVYALLVNF